MRVDSDSIELASHAGLPQARVPAENAWDLVDYLAQQRVQVTYSFEADRLIVNFHHMGIENARCILESWQHSSEREMADIENHPSNDQWLVGRRHAM